MVTNRKPAVVTDFKTPAPALDLPQDGSTRGMIADLIPGESQRRARTARAVAATSSDERIDLATELSARLAKSGKLTAEERQALAQKILGAQIDEIRASMPGDQLVLAEMMKALDDDLANIGGQFDEFQTLSPTEIEHITAATTLVDLCKAKVVLAQTKLTELQSAWFFKESRSEAAREELMRVEAEVVSAEVGVTRAKEQAKIDQEKRLLSADFSVHYDRFTKRIADTCAILEKSRDGALTNYEQVVDQLRVTFEDKTAASAAMEKLDEMILAANEKLAQDQEQVVTLEAGSPERMTLEQSISEQVNRVQELTGKRNEALAIFQAKERATPELETHRDTILAQYHVHRMNLASLRANSDSWRAAFDSRLEQMKGMASIDASSKIDSVGAVLAQDGAEKAAQALVASVTSAVEMIEKHDARLAKMKDVKDIQDEGMAALRARFEAAMVKTKTRDGRAEEHQASE